MNRLARIPLSDIQPGDEVRTSRTAPAYRVAAIAREHGSWTVTDHDGTVRHYATGARLLRNQGTCDGQASLDLDGAA